MCDRGLRMILSICLSCDTFFTMFLSSYHHFFSRCACANRLLIWGSVFSNMATMESVANFEVGITYSWVATVREKSGKFQSFSESGKSQGVWLQVREFCNLLSKSGKSQGISPVMPIDVYYSSFGE